MFDRCFKGAYLLYTHVGSCVLVSLFDGVVLCAVRLNVAVISMRLRL